MRRSTHALVGAAAGSVIASASGSDFISLMLIGGLFGVLPDIDILVGGVSRSAHRSPATHSLLGAAALTVVWVIIYLGASTILGPEHAVPVPLSAGSATAFSSAFLHAAADTASLSGCKALYPLSRRRFRGPVRYDDWAANSAISLVALAVILASGAVDLSAALSMRS